MCQCYSRVLRKWFCCDCLTGPCFPGTATAVVYPGKGVAMHSLQPGDRVLAVDPTGGNLIWTRVLAFLDRRPEELAEYLHLETDLHTSLAVSANHVLLTPGDDANNNGSTSASSCQGFGYQSRFAADIRPGERLFVASGNSVLTAEVRTIKRTIEKGAFVPLTAEGNLIVDGTLASCYATFHHDWSHMALRPLISVVQQWPASQHTVQAFTGHYVSFLKWAGNVLLPEGRLKFGDKRNTGVLKTISPETSPLDLVDSYAKKCFFSILTSV
ncbi:unnamed protein product [Notodromas monacha]|uniref:Uncharacterized protein n=1 Tax=Notodromas monacha TaxID=399045 RepID=A0A7R9BTM6_9CRUS|nr:unnamed protein product [Notodromas monacha]CAG0920495.1 unnamed protein product [Notodromas monacha]